MYVKKKIQKERKTNRISNRHIEWQQQRITITQKNQRHSHTNLHTHKETWKKHTHKKQTKYTDINYYITTKTN